MTLPLLILTPHSSNSVPLEVLHQMLGESVSSRKARGERVRWLFAEGDPYTDLLFHTPGAHHVHAGVNRFVVDLNRPRDQGGDNGVIKLTDFERRPLYPPGFVLDDHAREQRLRRYWDPYHREVEAILEREAVRVLIDGHAMMDFGPAIGPDHGAARPAICLMTGGDGHGEARAGGRLTITATQARGVLERAEKHFRAVVGASPCPARAIVLNDPWSGDETSLRYSEPRRERAVPAFGLEFNRALYLRETTGAEPLEEQIIALNRAFQAFAQDVLELF